MPEENMTQNNPVNSDDCVDFLIITALPEERDAMLQQLGNCQRVQNDNFPTYYRTTLETDSVSDNRNPRVAVTMQRHPGNIYAAVRTAQCLQHLKPNYVLMVGIAGGVEGKVNLGDVVVCEEVIYYENTKENHGFSDQRPQVLRADWMLLDRAKNYTDINWHNFIHVGRPADPRSTDAPTVHFGPIASGEKVIANVDRLEELRQLHSKLAAVEMESFGVALATSEWTGNPKFIAFRGVSDYADESKDDSWQAYAADSAAAFTVGFLRSGGIPLRVVAQSQHQTGETLVAIRHQSMEPLPSLSTGSLPDALGITKIVDIVIDQTDLYNNDRLKNPVEAAIRQMDITSRLSETLNTYPDAEVGYCGIAHIPLVFHIGCQVLTRIPLHLFDHNRHTKQWDLLQSGEDDPQITLEGLPDIVTQEGGDVIVRVSISYPVTPEDVEGIVTNPIASLDLRIDPPKIDVVTSMEQLQQYSRAFRDMLDEIHNKLPNTERVHIFYAGPVPLAVYFGRQISKTIHPRIIVYNHSSKDAPRYAWGLEVTADVDSPDFMIKIGG